MKSRHHQVHSGFSGCECSQFFSLSCFFEFFASTYTDPTLIPLPTTSDADLHGPTAASASGCTPAVKVAGSCRKVIPDLKGKGKRRLEEMSELDVSDSEGESEPSKAKNAHSGHQPGAGNYQDADLKELLCLVEGELPIGGHGWKQIDRRAHV